MQVACQGSWVPFPRQVVSHRDSTCFAQENYLIQDARLKSFRHAAHGVCGMSAVISTLIVRFQCVFLHHSIKKLAELKIDVVKSSAIQNNSVTLSSVIIAIIVCKSLYFSTIKLQQFSLITKSSNTYISSNSRNITWPCIQYYLAMYPILLGHVSNITWPCIQYYLAMYPILLCLFLISLDTFLFYNLSQ